MRGVLGKRKKTIQMNQSDVLETMASNQKKGRSIKGKYIQNLVQDVDTAKRKGEEKFTWTKSSEQQAWSMTKIQLMDILCVHGESEETKKALANKEKKDVLVTRVLQKWEQDEDAMDVQT